MVKAVRFLMFLGFCYGAFAYSCVSDSARCTYTYKGQGMTPENILELSPQAPEDLKNRVEAYLKAHPGLMNLFVGHDNYKKLDDGKAPFAFKFGGGLTPAMKRYLDDMACVLEQAGIDIPQDQGRYQRVLSNFTVFLGKEWVIKSSGFLNRRANILHEMGQDNRDPELPQEKLDEFQKKYGPYTYQTISRMPYWLMVKEGIEKYQLDRIALPKMYLVQMPGRPAVVNDSNYVIVEENIGGRQSHKEVDLQDPELKRQYDTISQYADLWDRSDPNFRMKDGKLYPVDTEGPNNQKPSNFFWKDKARKQ